MRRRKGSIDDLSNPLDCFLDVVCNLIGVLLLAAIISALAVKENVYDVFTPVEQPTKGSRHYLFAATPEGIYPFEKNAAYKKLKMNPANHTAETRYFRYTREIESKRTTCIMKKSFPLITEMNVSTIMEELQRLRKSIRDNDNFFVCFNVSPDESAFRLFRLARKELWENGIKVGWVPIDPEKKIFFQKGGLEIVPQG
jgi:hypothetical protein